MRRLARPAKIIAIYALLGPLVGLIVFALGIGVMAAIGAPTGGAWLTPFFLIYGFLFAHVVGLPWATLAGAVAAAADAWLGRPAVWIGPASGLVSFLGAGLFGAIRLPAGPDTPIVDSFTMGFAGVMLLTHLLAATLCWRIAR